MKRILFLGFCVVLGCAPRSCEEAEKHTRTVSFFIILTELPKGGPRRCTYKGVDAQNMRSDFYTGSLYFNENAMKAQVGDTLEKKMGELHYLLKTKDTTYTYRYSKCCGSKHLNNCLE